MCAGELYECIDFWILYGSPAKIWNDIELWSSLACYLLTED